MDCPSGKTIGEGEMRNNAKTLGWGIALVAVAAVVTAGSVYAASSSGGDSGKTTQLTMEQMRSVLVPAKDLPESRYVSGPMTFEQAAAANAFAAPPSMVFSPRSCATYLEDALGPMSGLRGWVQFGSRVDDNHNDNFVHAVVTLPNGATPEVLSRIREAAFTCRTGTLTLEGQATGDITYTERPGMALPGANTIALTGRTQFKETPGTQGYRLVTTYEMPPSAQLLVNLEQACVAEVNIAASGSTLIVAMEANLDLSQKVATAMYSQVQAMTRA
jgi:hypothetical protein